MKTTVTNNQKGGGGSGGGGNSRVRQVAGDEGTEEYSKQHGKLGKAGEPRALARQLERGHDRRVVFGVVVFPVCALNRVGGQMSGRIAQIGAVRESFVCVSACVRVCICTCVHVRVYVRVYAYVCVSTIACVYMCMCECVQLYWLFCKVKPKSTKNCLYY